MFAIAKNKPKEEIANPITFIDWHNKFIKNNFINNGFMIENIKINNNFNPRFLSKMEIGNIQDKPINFIDEHYKLSLSQNYNCHNKMPLPFGIPHNHNSEWGYEYILNEFYRGHTGNMRPDDNITCSVLFAIMRQCVYLLGRTLEIDEEKEKHYIRTLLSLYQTTKYYKNIRLIFKNLIDCLCNCSSARDVTQKEIAIILNNKEINETLMEEILIIGLARSIKYYKKDYGKDAVLTLQDPKFLRGKFGLFFIIPALKVYNTYADPEITAYHARLCRCYDKFNALNIDMKSKDEHWIYTSKILKGLYDIMIDENNLNITHKPESYFVELLTKISNCNIKYIDDLLYKQLTPIIIPVKIPYSGDLISIYPTITKLDDKNYELISPRITKWSTFVINLKQNQMVGIDWKNVLDSSDFRILSMEYDKLNIINNKGGFCSLVDKTLTNKEKKEKFVLVNDSSLIRRNGNYTEIYTDQGIIFFKSSTVAIAIKNIKVTLHEIN